MNLLHDLFAAPSVAGSLVVLGTVIALGHALGHLRVAGVGLGVAGVLFSGLLFGHFRLTGDPHVLEFVREFGLVLFVYCLGLQIGPAFFGSLKQQGLKLNLLAAGGVILGGVLAACFILFMKQDVAAAAGIFSGATTNTPSLAAGQEALKLAGAGEEASAIQGLAYAVCYPFGIIGIILVMLLIRRVYRIDVRQEVTALEEKRLTDQPRLLNRNYEVKNPNLDGCPLARVPGFSGSGVVVSRLLRGRDVLVARAHTVLQRGDIVHAVGTEEALAALRIVVGDESPIDVKEIPGSVTHKRLLVTQKSVLGKTIAGLDVLQSHHVVITRVTRGGTEFSPGPTVRLQFGDVLMAVGTPEAIDAVAEAIGNSPKALDHPQLVPFFVGIALGVIAGSVPLVLPSVPVPVKLGLAGGPLVVAILLSRLGRIGPLVWHVPTNANLMLRELGISLFLAAVGLKSGEKFIEILLSGNGLLWLGLGALVTFVPLLIMGLLARGWQKMNYAEICGLLAGSMTDPPALAFAHQTTGSEAPAVAYATVYPLTMMLRVLVAQLLVIFFYLAAGG